MLLLVQLERGHVIGITLFGALLIVLAIFGAGYWYFINRGHQSDEPPEAYRDDHPGSF